eukprot:Platyproteum_vivax@DN7651_c0_g1_i11.p1
MAEIDALRKQNPEEINQMAEAHRAEIEAKTAELTKEIENLKKQNPEEIDKLVEAHRAEMESKTSELLRQIEALKSQNPEEINKLLEEHRAALQTKTSEFVQEKENLRASLEAEIAALKERALKLEKEASDIESKTTTSLQERNEQLELLKRESLEALAANENLEMEIVNLKKSKSQELEEENRRAEMAKENALMAEKIESISRMLTQSEIKMTENISTIEELAKEKANILSQNSTILSEFENLKKKHAEGLELDAKSQAEKAQKLEIEVETLRKQNKEAETAQSTLALELEEIQKLYQQVGEDFKKAIEESKATELLEKNAALLEELETTKSSKLDIEAQLVEFQSQIDSFKSENEKLANSSGSFASKITGIEEAHAEVVKNHEIEVSKLTGKVESLNAEVTDLRFKNESILSAIEKDYEDFDFQSQKLSDANKSVKEEMEDLENFWEKMEALNLLRHSCDELKVQNTMLFEEAEKMRKEMPSLLEMKRQATQIEILQKEHQNLQKVHDDLEGALVLVKTTSGSVDDLQAQTVIASNLASDNQKLLLANEDLTSEVNAVKVAISASKAEFVSQIAQIENWTKENEKLSAENTKLKSQIDQAKLSQINSTKVSEQAERLQKLIAENKFLVDEGLSLQSDLDLVGLIKHSGPLDEHLTLQLSDAVTKLNNSSYKMQKLEQENIMVEESKKQLILNTLDLEN